MGGLIAWEMAQRLKAQGEQIAALILIDSYVANPAWTSPTEPDLKQAFATQMTEVFGIQTKDQETEAAYQVYRANLHAWLNYKPKPLTQPVTLLTAAEASDPNADPTHGFASLVPLTQVTIPGTHQTMLHRPNVEKLTETIKTNVVRDASRNVVWLADPQSTEMKY